ncbi:MAG: hypothetical protein ACQ9MH_11535 [Nitrospinales bacterium]
MKAIKRTLYCFIIVLLIIIISPLIYNKIYPPPKTHGQAQGKNDLHNLFLSCNAFWKETNHKTPCTLSVASKPEYGFVPSSDWSIIIVNGEKKLFHAKADSQGDIRHFSIDSNGKILEKRTEPDNNWLEKFLRGG